MGFFEELFKYWRQIDFKKWGWRHTLMLFVALLLLPIQVVLIFFSTLLTFTGLLLYAIGKIMIGSKAEFKLALTEAWETIGIM